MADQSVISAVVTRYAAISFPVTKPNLWFADIPQTTSTGAVQELPYINLTDEGTTPDPGYDLEYNPVEVTRFRLEVYASTLASVDTIMWALKYGTGAVTAGGGFDFATLTITGQ